MEEKLVFSGFAELSIVNCQLLIVNSKQQFTRPFYLRSAAAWAAVMPACSSSWAVGV